MKNPHQSRSEHRINIQITSTSTFYICIPSLCVHLILEHLNVHITSTSASTSASTFQSKHQRASWLGTRTNLDLSLFFVGSVSNQKFRLQVYFIPFGTEYVRTSSQEQHQIAGKLRTKHQQDGYACFLTSTLNSTLEMFTHISHLHPTFHVCGDIWRRPGQEQ